MTTFYNQAGDAVQIDPQYADVLKNMGYTTTPPPVAPNAVPTANDGSSPLSVSQLGAYLKGTYSNPVQLVQASPETALQQQFMQSPAYQLQFGQNYEMDPSMRFGNDSGVQMAVASGMPGLTNQYSAKGLGNSGALSQALSQYMYNNYNNYVGSQGQLFNNYQNQLNNLAQFGSTQTGGQQAYNAYTNQAGLLGQVNMTTGQNLANASLGVAENIAQLYGNQGVFGGNAVLGTAANQANNNIQGLQMALAREGALEAGGFIAPSASGMNAAAAGGSKF